MTVVVLVDRFDPDPGADLLVNELDHRGVDVFRADPAWLPEHCTVACELSGSDWVGRLGTDDNDIGRQCLDLASITGVYYRRPTGHGFDFGMSGGAHPQSAAQARLGIGGLLSAVGSWMNHPQRSGYADYVPIQLRAACDVGVRVPQTCITNEPVTARRFVRAVGHAVYTPFRGHGVEDEASGPGCTPTTATALSPADCDERLPGTVHLLRQWIPHDQEVRLIVVDDRVFAACADIRRDRTDAGRSPVVVPPTIRYAVRSLLRGLGLRCARVDFAVDDHDRWWFLGCDPNFRWARIQEETGLPITVALADALDRTCRA